MHSHVIIDGNGSSPSHNGGHGSLMVDAAIKEIFFTVTFGGFGILICFLGTVANTVNLTVLLKQDFGDTINISLFGLAVSDGGCLLTQLWVNIAETPGIENAPPAIVWIKVARVSGAIPYTCFARISGLITMYVTFERSLCIASPLRVKAILTPSRTTCITVFFFIIMIAVTIPTFTVNRIGWQVLGETNRSVLSNYEAENRAQVEEIVFMLNNIFGYVTFTGIIICTTILITFLNAKARWRQRSVAVDLSSSVVRDRKITRLVVAIASVFIICYFPRTLLYFAIMIDVNFDMYGQYHDFVMMVLAVSYCMESLNCSVSVLIYRSMSSKYRRTVDLMITNMLKSVRVKVPFKTRLNNQVSLNDRVK